MNCHTAAALSGLVEPSSDNDAQSRKVLAAAAALASACEAWGIFLVQLSSNAVFGYGDPAMPCAVDMEPHPQTPLGWRSLAAEQEVLSRCSCAAVLRVPPLYGPVECLDECAVTRASP